MKILIPLDGSKIGESALPYVENLISKLSPQEKVEVVLLQVLPRTQPYITGGYEVPSIIYTEEEVKARTEAAMNYLNQSGDTLRSKGVSVISEVKVGDASEEIIKTADEIKADLIAMSTHGRSGISRWAFGSVTDKVLRRGGKVPILTVKATTKPGK